jgi:hypothetical protein
LITQLPVETKVTVVPETVQTEGDPAANATVKPDEEVPLTETVPALNAIVLGSVNEIVCAVVVKEKVKSELVAAR